MARLMLFLITYRESFSLGLFTGRALQHGAFCSFGWKTPQPCLRGSGSSSMPRPSFLFCQKLCVCALYGHSDSRNQEMAFSLPVCVAPTRPVHSRAASEMVLAGVQRVAANIEGSRYF